MSQAGFLIVLLFIAPLFFSGMILIFRSSRIVVLSSAILSSLVIAVLTITAAFSIQNLVQWNWISFGGKSIDLVFEFNSLTVPLSIAVSVISLFVTLYSIDFFKWDITVPRYFATLNFFTISMLGLTLSGNLLQTFVFWEWVGVSSYLLIGFNRHRQESGAASTKALIMNRIGDAGFIVVLITVFAQTATLNISEWSETSLADQYTWIIAGGLFLAAFSKSAQFPFHTWLPDAMEGPTPVSALIHSATMVAAGVFLLIRTHVLLPEEALQLIAIVGITTALIGGVNALKEPELKKILAWSTVSQLGLMIMVVGLKGYESSFIHLLSHAIFKSGLFLVAGILISKSSNGSISDLTQSSKSVLVVIATLILCFSLMGLPLTVGFLSKEYLLSSISSTVYIALFFVVNLISILYSARVLSIFYPLKMDTLKGGASLFMLTPVLILSLGSIWILYSPSPLSAGWAFQQWNLTPPGVPLTTFSASWVLLWLGISFYLIRANKIHSIGSWVPNINFDNGLNILFIKPVLLFARTANWADAKILDKLIHGIVYSNFLIALIIRWLDINLVDGLARIFSSTIKSIGNLLRRFVAGKIQGYIWWTVVTLAILFIISRS